MSIIVLPVPYSALHIMLDGIAAGQPGVKEVTNLLSMSIRHMETASKSFAEDMQNRLKVAQRDREELEARVRAAQDGMQEVRTSYDALLVKHSDVVQAHREAEERIQKQFEQLYEKQGKIEEKNKLLAERDAEIRGLKALLKEHVGTVKVTFNENGDTWDLPVYIHHQVCEQLKAGREIQAIKLLREATLWDLKSSCAVVRTLDATFKAVNQRNKSHGAG